MSKAIMISIKPKYVAKILNGKKTIEIRKTMPKCDLPIDVYIYCTKGKETIAINPYGGYAIIPNKYKNEYFNGKVVAKFRLEKVEEIKKTERHDIELLEKSCLTATEFYDYLLNKQTFNIVIGYAWHISNLEIFDEPKELSEFIKCDNHHIRIGNCFIGFGGIPRLTKAPQSWCYVEVE